VNISFRGFYRSCYKLAIELLWKSQLRNDIDMVDYDEQQTTAFYQRFMRNIVNALFPVLCKL